MVNVPYFNYFSTLSLTSVLGKRFEKIICRRIVAILEELGFDVSQFAYLKERSATQALLYFTQSVAVALHNNKACGGIFFDFRDAFGSVNRLKLVKKLRRNFGISIRKAIGDYL